MGLLDLLMPGTNTTAWASPLGLPPVVQQNPFAAFVDQNRNKLVGAFNGLANASPNDPRGLLTGAVNGLTAGLPLDNAYSQQKLAEAAQQKQVADQHAQQNKTIQWLKANYPQYAGLPVDQGWQAALNDLKGGGTGADPASVKEYNLYVQQAKASGQDPMAYLDFKQQSSSSSAPLSPDSLKLIASQYLAGDKSAIVGFARNASARAQIANAVAEMASAKGMDGPALAAEISAYGGNVAAQRSAGTRAAQVGMAASEANQMADLALTASKNVPRSQFLPWNQIVQAIQRGTSDPNLARLFAATMSLVNGYARAVSPLGTPTDAMRAHAEEMLNNAQSPEAYAAVIDQMKQEMVAALAAPAEISQQLKASITGQPAAPAGPDTPPQGVDPQTWQYMTPEERALWQN